jgi:hypothetical protein
VPRDSGAVCAATLTARGSGAGAPELRAAQWLQRSDFCACKYANTRMRARTRVLLLCARAKYLRSRTVRRTATGGLCGPGWCRDRHRQPSRGPGRAGTGREGPGRAGTGRVREAGALSSLGQAGFPAVTVPAGDVIGLSYYE